MPTKRKKKSPSTGAGFAAFAAARFETPSTSLGRTRTLSIGLRESGAEVLDSPSSWRHYIRTDHADSRYKGVSTELYSRDPNINSVRDARRNLKRLGKRRKDAFLQPKGETKKKFEARRAYVIIVHCIFRSSERTYMYVPVRIESAFARTAAQWSEWLDKHGARVINGSATSGVVPGLNIATGKSWVLDSIVSITLGAASALPKHRSRSRPARGRKAGKKGK